MTHQTNTSNPVDFPTGCSHCSHPLYAGIRCSVCGRWTDTTHTCGFHCDRPECIKAQRDELRAKMEANTAEIRRYHRACEMALEALEDIGKKNLWWGKTEEASKALREALNTKPAE